MFRIYKVISHPTVDFAAEELRKYLWMMMPECGGISVEYKPDATDGFRLGLMSDFGLDTSEAEDLFLDDILHIDTDEQGGIIAGSNHRSVLLAVYRFFRENGCRWLFPGVDGELIPLQDIVPVKYHKMADCRYRGQCNEGAEYQPNMMEVIDFQPKIGMNVFMIEFDNPKVYYDYYYNAQHNTATRDPEPVTADTVKQWKRQCEAELAKRSLQFHDMGHGWTAEPFGISSTNGWVKEFDNPVPEESRELLALVNGKRELHEGVALNTQFCMSSPKARTIVAKYIANYAETHQNADYIHVWLADATRNHCECDECRKKIPSDWYVMLLNEIDECLTEKGLATRIVFICYTDTTWAPTVEKLHNTKRFSFMLAAITRVYTIPVPMLVEERPLPPYQLNQPETFPLTVEEDIRHAKAWRAAGECPSMVYEYHFWLHQYRDPGVLTFAKMIYDDIRGYRANGFDGLIEDGSQRSYFPNGFLFYVYAETLFDTNVSFEALVKDYFESAYGEIADDVRNYLAEISDAFSMEYIMSNDRESKGYFDPKRAKQIRGVKDIIAKYQPLFAEHRVSSYRARTVAMRLLKYHMEFCAGLAEAWVLKAMGADPEAIARFYQLQDSFGRLEYEIGTYFDQRMCFSSLKRLIDSPKTFYEAD